MNDVIRHAVSFGPDFKFNHIARTLGRLFQRVVLSGVRDEAPIRGGSISGTKGLVVGLRQIQVMAG